MQFALQTILTKLSRLIIRKHNPIVIGITGSIGKTSAKEAIFCVLKKHYNVRKSPKNYNNDIGVPLSIIGALSPGRSPLGWLKVLFRAFGLAFIKNKNYPSILILEMGADKPGDIARLTRLYPPTIGVLTAIAPAHTEFFGSLDRIASEKAKLIEALPSNGFAILNRDDERVWKIREISKAEVASFGLTEEATISAIQISDYIEEKPMNNLLGGINFKIASNGAVVPVFLPNVLGVSHVRASLIASLVGLHFGLNLLDISEALRGYEASPGRMRVIAGIKGTIIIDDTYNSSPWAARSAFETLGRLKFQENVLRYVVLGDMLELGSISEEAHRLIGIGARSVTDILIGVGAMAHWILKGAESEGFSRDRMFHFASAEEAGHFLSRRINPGDVVLIKGSQGARLEKVVKELMAEPLRASELLVRQNSEWSI